MPPTLGDAQAEADRVALARRPPGRPVMRQEWDHLLFLHWEVPAEAIAPLLPGGAGGRHLRGGGRMSAWSRSRCGGSGRSGCRASRGSRTSTRPTSGPMSGPGAGIPASGSSASTRPATSPARWGRSVFRLPYFHARMVMSASEDRGVLRLAYASSRFRSDPPPATTRVVAEVSAPVVPAAVGTLESFLAERYLLYAARGPQALPGAGPPHPVPAEGRRGPRAGGDRARRRRDRPPRPSPRSPTTPGA